MAIPHGDPHHERLPWWSQLSPLPKLPTLSSPTYEIDPRLYPVWLQTAIEYFPRQDNSYVPVPRGLPALLNEAHGQEPVNRDAPPVGGLLGVIEQYLRDSRQRGVPSPER